MAPSPHGCSFLGSGSPSGGQMLSFSFSYGSNKGLDFGCSDVTNMQGILARVKEPFTPTQWMELEHQALIYRHIVANAPVPASFLLSIRRSPHHPVFPHFSSGGTLASSSLGWGSFQLGYSGSANAEPGRCRRTDGKKWRCSRDAVVDQKYCERHINRGHHRSRKHVEGRSSHGVKAMLAISQPTLGVFSGKSSSNQAMAQQSIKTMNTNLTNPSLKQFDRLLLDKTNMNDHAQDSINHQYFQSMFQNTKGANSSEKSSSQAEYMIVSTGSLMNTPQSENVNLNPERFLSKQAKPNPANHLFGKELQPDNDIQLSISIPIDNSNSSHNYGEPHIGLEVCSSSNDRDIARASWIPVSWETSIGGPLGEFFTNTSNSSDDKNKNFASRSLKELSTNECITSPHLH